jgi:drug/metabolite transporter (DMT)-like permease
VRLEVDLAAAVLLAAVLHAVWNSFVKAGRDRLASMTVIAITGGVLVAPGVALLPLPAAPSIGYLVGSVLTHLVYFFFLIRAYRFGDLSRVYPMARGIAPPAVAILAAFAAGEVPNRREIAGIALVSFGIASLVFDSTGARRADDRLWFWLALLTGATIALYTVIDGMGARRAGDALSYIVWLHMGDAVMLTIVSRVRRGRAIWRAVRGEAGVGALAGIMATLAYGIVIYAMSRGAMAYVSALRETSVVIAALIGTVVLGEEGTARRVAAAAVVAAGVILMSWRG